MSSVRVWRVRCCESQRPAACARQAAWTASRHAPALTTDIALTRASVASASVVFAVAVAVVVLVLVLVAAVVVVVVVVVVVTIRLVEGSFVFVFVLWTAALLSAARNAAHWTSAKARRGNCVNCNAPSAAAVTGSALTPAAHSCAFVRIRALAVRARAAASTGGNQHGPTTRDGAGRPKVPNVPPRPPY